MVWFNNNWNRRKSIIINGTTTPQTDYQIQFVIYRDNNPDTPGNIHIGTNVNNDFSDIRFTSSDGSTPINYWIESYAIGSSAVIWVKINSISASPSYTNIYIYYDNLATISESNIHNTFLFGDDFEDATWTNTHWIIYKGSYTIVNDTQRDGTSGKVLNTSTNVKHTALIVGVASDNIIIDADVKPISQQNNAVYAIIFRGDSEDLQHNHSCLQIEYKSNKNNLNYPGCGSNLRNQNVGWSINNWYILRTQISGSSLLMTLLDANKNILSTINRTDNCDITESYVGIYSGDYVGNNAHYNNFRVRKYASPEPTPDISGSEEIAQNIVITDILIGDTQCMTGCNITCSQIGCPPPIIENVTITWQNNGGDSVTFTPTLNVTPPGATDPTIYTLSPITVNVGASSYTTFPNVNLGIGNNGICPIVG